MKTNSFKEQVVVITGASSGIGKALSLQLADEGAFPTPAHTSVFRPFSEDDGG